MDNICEFRVLESSSDMNKLKRYFKSFMYSGVPSSMPCPCCGKIMVRSDRYKKERSYMHPLMFVATGKHGNERQCTAGGTTVLCENCSKNQLLTLPKHYIIDGVQ